MKKSIFILILALFAFGIETTYAQPACPLPRPVECLTGDALHPVAGNPYTYEVNVPTPPGTKSYQWYVTQNQNFIAGGVINTATADPGDGTGNWVFDTDLWYLVPTDDQPTISITWKSFTYDAANPVFVVINVVSETPCHSQNLKVYKIEPQNAFTLDIANVDQAGVALDYELPYNFCIHDIVTATYDPTAPEGVLYDFGVDYMYFIVSAANFSESWMPTLTLTGIDAEETVTVEWAYPTDIIPAYTPDGTFTLSGGIWTTPTPVDVVDPSGSVGTNGECIVIRVTLDHSNGALNYEGLDDEPITLAVDGTTNLTAVPPAPLPDVHYALGADCGLPDGYDNDLAVQTLNMRPDIQTGGTMPAPGLLPVKP